MTPLTPYSPDSVLQAARAIRPYLPALLDIAVAHRLEQQLNSLLPTVADESDADQQILALLQEQAVTREWLRLYLEEQRPAEDILKQMRTYYPLSENKGAIASPRYLCPVASCNRDWYRHRPEEAIPECPIHGVPMVRVSKQP